MSLIELEGEDLALALCSELEIPPAITAREARTQVRNFAWVSCHDFPSPAGWWVAEIGTDHGPPEEDDAPVEWRPLPELADLIDRAWRVVDEMYQRGWLLHILQMTDGWVVNGRRYELPPPAKGMTWRRRWQEAVNTTDTYPCWRR